MPELPEVQTIVNDLAKKIVGAKIIGFETAFQKAVKVGLKHFKSEVIGKRILEVARKGKYILIHLSNKRSIIIHLRMTGKLIVLAGKKLPEDGRSLIFFGSPEKNIRHYFVLRNGKEKFYLLFSDVRKFGTIDLAGRNALGQKKEFRKMGIEPVSKNFTLSNLKAVLSQKSKTAIRNVLLDQTAIAGIGNIYASEILHRAGIDPRKTASSLDEKGIRRLYAAVPAVLKKAIKFRGTTFNDYRDTEGKSGLFQNELAVYGRKGDKCKTRNCQGRIEKEKISQRSAFYCPECQK